MCCILDVHNCNSETHLEITPDISGLPFQVAKFSMTRLYKPIIFHMHTSSLLCTQSHCRYKHTVVSHTKHDITRKAGTGSSLGNSIQTLWPTQGFKEDALSTSWEHYIQLQKYRKTLQQVIACDIPFGGKYAFDWALCGQSTVRGPNRTKCSLISSAWKRNTCEVSEWNITLFSMLLVTW